MEKHKEGEIATMKLKKKNPFTPNAAYISSENDEKNLSTSRIGRF